MNPPIVFVTKPSFIYKFLNHRISTNLHFWIAYTSHAIYIMLSSINQDFIVAHTIYWLGVIHMHNWYVDPKKLFC